MNSQNIDNVFSVYSLLRDSIRITKRSINRDLAVLNSRTCFLGETKDEALEKISDAETELDDIMVLSLFASFERELRISIQTALDSNMNKINETIAKLATLTSDSIERWTVSDMVDSLSDVVDLEVRSQVKQIYEYRNWVAHGKNINRLPAARADPKMVQRIKDMFVSQAKQAI